MYPEWLPEGALPLLGMRGRLGSEQVGGDATSEEVVLILRTVGRVWEG